MNKLLIILICFCCGLSSNAQPASVRFQETFEYSRYFPLSGTAINKVHGIENAVPNDTANGGLYDSTLIRVGGPFAAFRGSRYVHFQLKKGWPLVGSAQRYRSEVVIFKPDEDPQFADLMPNVWYSFAILFPAVGMESDFTSRDIINQWFEDANSDNTIKVDGGKVYFEATPNTGSTTKLRFDLFGQTITAPQSNNVSAMVPIPRGEWHEFVFHIIHSTTNGLVDIWRDGQWIHHITGKTMHLMYPKWKIGIYKSNFDLSVYDSRVLYFDNIRVGDSTATLQDMMSQTNANIPPTARAGSDQTITLPTASVNLDGSGSTDGDGTISSYAWSKISGPSTYTITSPSTATTSVTGLVAGIYQFQLTVTDNNSAANSDVVQITVNPAPNTPPIANAGNNQTVTLPTNTASIDGSMSYDPDGTITDYAWVKVSGPNGDAITSPSSAVTGITGLTQGTYVYRLTVTDNGGLTATDLTQIIVYPAVIVNMPPVANAGSNQTITLPTNSTTLDGSNSYDTDGTITVFEWSQLDGPNTAGITTPNVSITGITGLIAGTYTFQLFIQDNLGDTAIDAIQVVVYPKVPVPPIVSAGADTSISIPINQVTLTGTASDPDGTVTVQWLKVSGPNIYQIIDDTTLTPTMANLAGGTYIFRMIGTDNEGNIATNDMTLTVINNFPVNTKTYAPRARKVINSQ